MVFRLAILFFSLGICTQSILAQTRSLDSLRKVLAKKGLSDTTRILAEIEFAYEMRFSKSDSSILIAKKALQKSKQLDFKKGIAGAIYIEGIWFSLKGKYQESLQNYFKCLEIYEEIKFEKGKARVLNNIGIIYYYQKNYKKAEEFLNKSLVINERIQNFAEIARALNNLGRNSLEENEPQKAFQYFIKAISILEQKNIGGDIAIYFCNMAEAQMKLLKYKEALQNTQKSLQIAIKAGNKRIESRSMVVMGAIYLETNKIVEAKRFLELAAPIAQKLNFPEEYLLSLEYSYKLYEQLKDYEKAYSFFKKYKNVNDTLVSQVNYKIALQREYEYNEGQRKIQHEFQVAQRKRERGNEIWIRYLLIGGVIMALGMVFFALRAFRIKSKAFAIISQQQAELQVMNEELIQSQEEITTQGNFIEEQNKSLSYQNTQIKQSINTALAIQKALLPFDSRLNVILKDYFVFYKPRDIVSGDFYWIEKVDNKVIVVVADCTGHGVPGAFMSLVGINLLERIVLQQGTISPAQILHDLHNLVRTALKQDEVENQSGMDLGIVVMENILPTEMQITFAGAKRPLHYIDAQNPTVIGKIAGSRKSIGGFQNPKTNFENVCLILPTNSVFYLSSDGLTDQNNKERKRLQDEPIFKVLLENYSATMLAQHIGLQNLLTNHMMGTEQRDDILLLGVQV